MFPKLFSIEPFHLFGRELGPFTLHTYGVLLAVAFLAGLWVVSRQAQRAGLDAAKITDLSIYVLLAGLLGARVLLVVVDWRHIQWSWREFLSVLQSGGVFYGGLLGALPVAWWFVRRHGLPGWATADVLVPGVAIGQAVGRLGCLAAGCCYGRPTSVPWAITFTDVNANRQVGTPMDTPLHPTQLYETAATLLIFAVLLRVARKKRFAGQVTLLYFALYSVARFVIEIFRGDAARGTVFGGALSTSQFIAILLLLAAAALFPRLAKTRTPAPQPS
jgi:phosphatidylglycerol:prolipoprotein diacylglycerol transferase